MSRGPFSGKTLAVMLGGTAAERSISLQSGENVARALEQGGANVLRVDPAEKDWPERLKEASFVFNLLHGPGGEDGTVQGLFELMKLPYSGCGLLASALTMDKVRTKWVWQGVGLATPRLRCWCRKLPTGQAVIEALGTVFVKPALEGSSLGMSKATRRLRPGRSCLPDASRGAMAAAVMAEQFVAGAEYTVAILKGQEPDPVSASTWPANFTTSTRSIARKQTRFTCPSDLTRMRKSRRFRALARDCAFDAVGGEVWGRVDVMRDPAGRLAAARGEYRFPA